MTKKPPKPTARKRALDDLKRSGLTANDAKQIRVEFIDGSGFAPVDRYRLPYFELNGNTNCFYRERLLGGGTRYRQPPATEPRLYVPPLKVDWREIANDVGTRVFITEGEKKSAAGCKAGSPTIGLGGVFNFLQNGKLISDFDLFAWRGREVWIVFDTERLQNHQVASAEWRLAVQLERLGAIVGVLRLPLLEGADKTALDDFLVARGAKALGELPLHDPAPPEKCDDVGNGRRLARLHTGELCWTEARGWMHYNGCIWVPGDGAAIRAAKNLQLDIADEARREKKEDQRDKLLKWAASSGAAPRVKAALDMAQSEESIRANAGSFDADTNLLATQNGVVNLRTGELNAAEPDDLLTKQTGVAFDPKAHAPQWNALLRRAQPDKEVRAFLQRFSGATALGGAGEKAFLFLWGVPDSAKTTIVEVVAGVLGTYARATSAETFMELRYGAGRGPTPERVALRGARLVHCGELTDAQRFDAAFIKHVTGGDTISGRDLYSAPVEFRPQFLVWMHGNHRPALRGDDPAVWRRVNVVPFEVSIPRSEQVPDLARKLVEEEGAGILNWIVQGALDYQRQGLNPPPAVRTTTDAYRDSNDWLGQFINDRCVTGAAHRAVFADLYSAYRVWCINEGARHIETKPRFKARLEERGLKTKAGKANVKFVHGIALAKRER